MPPVSPLCAAEAAYTQISGAPRPLLGSLAGAMLEISRTRTACDQTPGRRRRGVARAGGAAPCRGQDPVPRWSPLPASLRVGRGDRARRADGLERHHVRRPLRVLVPSPATRGGLHDYGFGCPCRQTPDARRRDWDEWIAEEEAFWASPEGERLTAAREADESELVA